MRFIIMHKTNAHWEAGALPSSALIARVGTMLGELSKAGVLLGAEGLRPSSEGVRLKFSAVYIDAVQAEEVDVRELE